MVPLIEKRRRCQDARAVRSPEDMQQPGPRLAGRRPPHGNGDDRETKGLLSLDSLLPMACLYQREELWQFLCVRAEKDSWLQSAILHRTAG